jgi:hypothetical protein
VAHTCNSSIWEAEARRLLVGARQKEQDPISKIKKKRAGGVAQVVECLPIKCEAWSSGLPTKIFSGSVRDGTQVLNHAKHKFYQ